MNGDGGYRNAGHEAIGNKAFAFAGASGVHGLAGIPGGYAGRRLAHRRVSTRAVPVLPPAGAADTGASPSGKARDFDSLMRWFEPSRPCQPGRAKRARRKSRQTHNMTRRGSYALTAQTAEQARAHRAGSIPAKGRAIYLCSAALRGSGGKISRPGEHRWWTHHPTAGRIKTDRADKAAGRMDG